MTERMIYRRQLLRAVETFLEETPSAQMRAQLIIQDCVVVWRSRAKGMTLDNVIWGFFIQALTDSIYYESKEFLRDTYEILLGQNSRNTVRVAFSDDYRTEFTLDEVEWYTQLMSMGDFLTTIPFMKLQQAVFQTSQSEENKGIPLINISEVAQVEKIEEEYLQKKKIIEDIAARSPSPENAGDELIYHFVLREVTSLLTEISVGMAAVSAGYPILSGPHSTYKGSFLTTHKYPNMTESLLWAKRSLEALAGKGDSFISWRLSKATTFDGDILVVSLH